MIQLSQLKRTIKLVMKNSSSPTSPPTSHSPGAIILVLLTDYFYFSSCLYITLTLIFLSFLTWSSIYWLSGMDYWKFNSFLFVPPWIAFLVRTISSVTLFGLCRCRWQIIYVIYSDYFPFLYNFLFSLELIITGF